MKKQTLLLLMASLFITSSASPGIAEVDGKRLLENSQVDLGFPAGFDAESGPATDNLDSTCSSFHCHGNENW